MISRRRYLFLITQNIHKRWISVPPGGVRTHNPNKRAALDPRLRPRGHWDRHMHFYIHASVHRNSILIRSNEMWQYAGVYLLQNHSTCFGCPSYPSSGVHKTVTEASGTCHSIRATTLLHRGLIRPRWSKVVSQIRDMTCTRGCSYIFMYSWWWVWAPETCWVILQ